MSQIVIDEIQGRTSTTVTDVNNLSSQIAQAWVNFDGTGTVAIRDSYNVSSITDNGKGDYTINFTAAMSNANYSVYLSGNTASTNDDGRSFMVKNPTTSSVGFHSVFSSDGTTESDAALGYVSVFGGI